MNTRDPHQNRTPFFLLFLLLLFSFPDIIHSQDPIFQALIQNLNIRNIKTETEMVYVHMDREVYAPGDTVWFNAYVRDRQTLAKSDKSQTLFVYLLDDRGNTLDHGRFLIEDSNAKGQFTLDHKLKEGTYILAAFSSWMENFEPDQVYHKKFLVRYEQRREYQIDLDLDRNLYFPGDTVRAVVKFYDELNREKEGVGYRYRLYAGNDIYLNGRSVSVSGSYDTLKLPVPDHFSDLLHLDVHAYWGNNVDSSILIPAIGDIQLSFFPEGGHRIRGEASVVAFKAISQMGLPVEVSGEVVGENGTPVLSTSSEHDGMGRFFLPAAPDQDLFFRIQEPPGFSDPVPLPGAQESGWQMSVVSRCDSIRLRILRKNTPETQGLLTVTVRDNLVFNTTVNVDSTEVVDIPTQIFPSGIAVLSLYDRFMRVQAERLVFIPPDHHADIGIKADRNTYLPRDRVRLQISPDSLTPDYLHGSYSLSVVDAPICLSAALDENPIGASFLLSPEIHGQINNPGYYFKSCDSLRMRHLDLLLCTQGWRDYQYIDTTDWYTMPTPTDGDRISGTLMKHNFGKLPEPSMGEINVFFGMKSNTIHIGKDGQFMVTPEYSARSNSGVLISGEVNGSNRYVILEIHQKPFESELPSYLRKLTDSLLHPQIPILSSNLSQADNFSLGIAYHEWIDEVVITKSRRNPKDEDLEIKLEDYVTQRKTVARKEYIESALDVVGILYNMGIPVNYEPGSDGVEYLLSPRTVIGWVVDGTYYGTSYSYVQNYVPKSIEEFTFIKGPETMYFGADVPEVIVAIRTRTYDPDDPNTADQSSKYTVPAFRESRKFYSPRYDTDMQKYSTLPDIRKTIYWNPDIRFDEDGSANLEFYNGDRYTRIRCILEGMTENGTPVHAEYDYQVGLARE